jgi:hypothetical protein
MGATEPIPTKKIHFILNIFTFGFTENTTAGKIAFFSQ